MLAVMGRSDTKVTRSSEGSALELRQQARFAEVLSHAERVALDPDPVLLIEELLDHPRDHDTRRPHAFGQLLMSRPRSDVLQTVGAHALTLGELDERGAHAALDRKQRLHADPLVDAAEHLHERGRDRLMQSWMLGDPRLEEIARHRRHAAGRQCDRGAVVWAAVERGDQAAHVARSENLEGEFTAVLSGDGQLHATTDNDVHGETRIAVMK